MARLDPVAVLGPGGAVSRRLQGYEVRDEQLRMAEAVFGAIESATHLMVEAGTGVGKSFAYLVPAIIAASEMGKRIVVSTSTKNLQEQLLQKDIPFLRTVLPEPFEAALLMGRGNYISLRRLDGALVRAAAPSSESQQLSAMHAWSKQTKVGTRSDLDFAPLEIVWEAAESDTGNCLKQACPRFRECFFFKAVKKARSASVIVVNHALYMSDLALRGQGAPGLLPDHDVAIFDEAHKLADVAANLLGLRVASGAIANLLNHLYNDRSKSGLLVYHGLTDAQDKARRTLTATDVFFDTAADWQSRSGSSNGRVREKTGLPETLVEELRTLATAIGQAIEPSLPAEQKIELESAQARCRNFAADLAGWLRHDEAESVYWIEVETRPTRRVVLARVPLDLGPILRRDLFDHVPTCIMTSATLSVGSPPSFHFSESRLGLPDDLPTCFQGSPFDYATQLTIHLAKGLPDPANETKAFEEAIISAIPHYVRKTQGKALVLFTSHRMMDEATRELSPWFRGEGIKLFSQSERASRPKLLKAFKDDVRSVLFGTDSFWQGIDVPGESLSNVIITKLPFDVPTQPLLEARYEAIVRQGGHSFLDYSVPEAVLKFKQGIGRLIRAKTDKGIVVILDPRVLSKPYGSTFRLSLPPGKQVIDDWRAGPPP